MVSLYAENKGRKKIHQQIIEMNINAAQDVMVINFVGPLDHKSSLVPSFPERMRSMQSLLS